MFNISESNASYQLMSDSVRFLTLLAVVVSISMLGCSSRDDAFREIEVSDNSVEDSETDASPQADDAASEESSDAELNEGVDPETVVVDQTASQGEPAEPIEASNTQAEASSGQDPGEDTSDAEEEPVPTPSVNSEESLASAEGSDSRPAESENSEADPASEKDDETEQPEKTKPSPARSLEEEMAAMRAKLLGLPDDAAGGEPREIKLLIPNKEFVRDEKTGALRITFDDIDLLKVLNMEPVPVDADKHLPNWLTELDGQRIVLRGWMFPTVKSEGIQRFLFVRDNGICCFGRMAKLYDKLGVTLKEGETTRYIEGRPFDVVGTFVLDPWILDDELDLLYHIEDAKVLDQ
ncbi:hypothetical protein AB1L42_08360 [Thalassoglobus sp. JC818]|uniref:hypothetical protein n=1 Tax=Thalassoglobus sp. JC818 TaxID=3232136 RepID=UPI00345B050D